MKPLNILKKEKEQEVKWVSEKTTKETKTSNQSQFNSYR